MKVAIVVQRYGAEINGGAEQHARYIAEHLARHVQVEVLTTCARDYITWRNELSEGLETINGVPVRRFPVSRERDPIAFGQWSEKVFSQTHALGDELAWLESEGPTSPALVRYIAASEAQYDFFIFFSFRYYHSFHGARAVAAKALLVPTAERDGALGLSLFPPVFRGIRAFLYNSYEERALIQGVAQNETVPGVVVGVGSEIPERSHPDRFRQKFGLRDRFAIYVGRIDENKGCRELFEYFEHYSAGSGEGLHLVLIGAPIIPIPDHPRVHHLGFVDDRDKFDAIAAAELLIMPSYLESLSMVALEAWALGKPVVANARCDVLQGQCLRSNAGLFYENYPEFAATLRAIDSTPSLRSALGRNGRAFYQRHYAWPVVEQKYLDMLTRLSKEQPTAAMAPIPGWFTRRRRTCPPAVNVVKALASGPVRPPVSGVARASAIDRPVARSPVVSTPVEARPPAVERPASPATRPAWNNRPPRSGGQAPDRSGGRRDGRGRPQQRGRRPNGGR